MGPPGDDKIIVLSDFDEEEVHEEKITGTKDAATPAVVKPASTASADDAPAGAKMIIMMINAPIRRLAATMTAAEMMSVSLRLPC
jgi:hypothetical protein